MLEHMRRLYPRGAANRGICVGDEMTFLQRRGIASFERLKPARCPAHKYPIRTEHRTLGIDANAGIGRTARVQPAHVIKH
ncbi:MAG: hypothetical protein JO258_13690 [Alphaproteobacteria bacterium]|nr:hypothetical protein [Alphaproteobacteria bacterium]